MFKQKWFVRLALLIGVAVFAGAAMTGCKSGGSSCGDSSCTSKH